MKKLILSIALIFGIIFNSALTSESLAKTLVKKIEVGSKYQGGIVAYLLKEGDKGYDAKEKHGIIVATEDLKEDVQWYHGSYIDMGAKGKAIGAGRSNTDTIVARQGEGVYAAKLCSDLETGGYSDWYLPSKDELNKIFKNKALLPGFEDKKTYWSSTSESNVFYAYRQGFFSGSQQGHDKKAKLSVRPVRSF